MEMPFPGVGTLINIVAVVLGSLAGMAFGQRLKTSTRSLITDSLGLVTLVVAVLSALSITSPALVDLVGDGAPMLLVLGALVTGGLIGAALGIERRMAGAAGGLQRWVSRRFPGEGTEGTVMTSPGPPGESSPDSSATSSPDSSRQRFIEGWLTASLLFCVGPLTILGSLNDGLGQGIDELALKSVLDFFASIAFAASFGVGVLFSAVSILVVQGGLTLVGYLLGSVVSEAYIDGLTAMGGLLLLGVAFRLLAIKDIAVGNLLPALAMMPLLIWIVSLLR